MRKQLIKGLKAHAEGHIEKHLANIEFILQKSTYSGSDESIIDLIQEEVMKIDKYDSIVEMVDKYIEDNIEINNSNYTTTTTE